MWEKNIIQLGVDYIIFLNKEAIRLTKVILMSIPDVLCSDNFFNKNTFFVSWMLTEFSVCLTAVALDGTAARGFHEVALQQCQDGSWIAYSELSIAPWFAWS